MTTKRRWWLYASVFAVAALVYANTVQNGFVLDDRRLVEHNPLIRGVEGIPILFRADYWAPKLQSGLYRPLVMSSYALNYEVSGLDPAGYHAVNVLLHALVSALVAAFFLRVSAHPAPAIAAAFLFATHAIHTEAVANVVGRAELLMALLSMVALLAFMQSRAVSRPRSNWLQASALLAYFLALLAKESAVTLLGVFVLFDLMYGPGERLPFGPRLVRTFVAHWRSYASFAALTGVYLGVRQLALPGGTLPPLLLVDNPLAMLDMPSRVLAGLQVALRYLGLAFWPLHLSYDYSFDQITLVTSLADFRAWAVLLAWGLVAAALIWAYRAAAELFFAMGFYVVTFSVVSNVLVPIGTILGERLLYLPSVGFCLALALFAWRLAQRLPLSPEAARAAFGAAFAIVVVLHGARTTERNPDWRSQSRLYLHDVEVVPNSTKALGNAGAILVNQEKHEEALELLLRGLEIYPQNEKASMMAGFAYTALGRDDDAMHRYDDALHYGVKDATVYNNLGFILVDRGTDPQRGVRLLEKAVQLAPKNPEYLDSLGWGYFKVGRLEKAREKLQQSLEIQPKGPSAPARRAHLAEIEKAVAARRSR